MEIKRDLYLDKLIARKTQWSNKSSYWYSAVRQVLFIQYALLQPPQSIRRIG